MPEELARFELNKEKTRTVDLRKDESFGFISLEFLPIRNRS